MLGHGSIHKLLLPQLPATHHEGAEWNCLWGWAPLHVALQRSDVLGLLWSSTHGSAAALHKYFCTTDCKHTTCMLLCKKLTT